MLALDTSLLEQLVLAVFIFSASIMFLAFALAALRSSREPRESRVVTPHVMAVAPRKPSGSVVEEAKTPINPPVNIEEKIREISQTPLSSRSIVLEIELPRIPEKIKLDFDKFRKFMEILREEEHHNFVVQGESEEEKAEERRIFCFSVHAVGSAGRFQVTHSRSGKFFMQSPVKKTSGLKNSYICHSGSLKSAI